MKIKYNRKTKILILVYSFLIILLALLVFIPSFFISKIIILENDKIISYILIFFLSLFLARGLFSFSSMLCGEKIKNIIEKEIREQVFNSFLKQNHKTLYDTNHNLLAIQTINSSKAYAHSFVNILEGICFVLTSFIYSFIYIGIQNIFLFLYSFLVIILWVFISFKIRPLFTKKQQEITKLDNNYSNFFFNISKNAFITSLYDKKDILIHRNKESILELYKNKKSLIWLKSWNAVFVTLMFVISQIGIILLSFYFLKNNMLKNNNSINSIIYLSGLFVVPIVRINKLFIDFLDLKNAKLIFQDIVQKWKFNNSNANQIQVESLHLINLSYKVNDKYLFKNVNITLNKNDILKINGKSGSGKTSLISLITKKDTEYEGKILINNEVNIKDVNYKISYIDQNNFILPLNLEDNLFINLKNKSQEVNKIFELLEISHLLKNQNNKINNLSGGEKRRLELARLFLSENNLIILDEAFVGIDETRKNKIINYLKEWSKEKIVIIITHDSNIQIHNKIIDLNS